MIQLTITDMTRKDADALRAIAEVYHPSRSAGAISFTAKMYKWAESEPAAPAGISVYDVKAGTNDAYDGTDGWSTTVLSAPSGTVSLYSASVEKSVPADTLLDDVKYDRARIVAESLKVGSLSSLGGPVGTLTTSGTIAPAMPLPTKLSGETILCAAPSLADQFAASVTKTAARVGATVKLHPHDNPAVGAPDQHALADKVFGGGTHGSPELDADAAKLEAIAGPGAAGPTAEQVFGGGITAAEQDAGWTTVPSLELRAASVTLSGISPELRAHAEKLDAEMMALATPDPAQVFGAGLPLPNVPAAIPTPPPLPPVTPPTLPPPLPVAPIGSLPPPPPPAPAPASASGAAPTTSPAQAETDSAGMPWDGRIHASTKTKTAKGVWTRRRGVEDSVVAEVEAQLRTVMAIPAPAAPPAWPFPADSSAVGGAPTFPTLMQFITTRIGDKRLNQEQVTAAVQAVGLESLNLVMARTDLIPAVMAELAKVAP